MSTLFLGRRDVRGLLDMREVVEAVEQAFRDSVSGNVRMPAKSYLLVEKGDFRAMPCALPDAAGVKWVNAHPGNPALGLPSVMAILVYNDPATGYPLAVMDATDITAYRTGATAAIASRYLARSDSHTLGIVGAGRQACTQLEAHAAIFDLGLVRVYDKREEAVRRFICSFPQYPVRSCSLEETVASDILCTVTPAREPFVKREWVRPGTHINAVGADAAGKEELEPDVLKQAVVVVDDIEQATSGGEINVPLRRGLFTIRDVHGTLGEIISGSKPGRTDDRAVTIFDSTGLALEDVAVARIVYSKATRRGGYLALDFVEEEPPAR